MVNGMNSADLATINAMNAIMDRLCGARDQAPTNDPAEQARLLAEGRALNPAYTLALAALQRASAEPSGVPDPDLVGRN